MSRGFWYVTALCLNWPLGVLSYYLLPSLGPAFAYSYLYEGLPQTGVMNLQESLLNNRLNILANPEVSTSIQGIAGFASLHVSVVFTAALFCHRAASPRVLRWLLWGYLVLTVLSTIYFGWHYILDDIAGFAIGWLCVAVGQRVTGSEPAVRGRRPSAAPPAAETAVEYVPVTSVAGDPLGPPAERVETPVPAEPVLRSQGPQT
jgi:hypothetical protein